MRLYHQVERGIKLPNKSVDKIFRGIICSVLDDLTPRFGKQVYDLEGVFGVDMKSLRIEYKQETRKVSLHQAVFLIGIDIHAVPYYHTSRSVRNRLENIESGEILIKCRVDTCGTYAGEGKFDPNSDVMTINGYRLVSACIKHLLGHEASTVAIEALKLYKVIQHEMMHVVQAYALPENQAAINPEYNCVDTTAGTRHDDYYTSTAEIKPYLANMQEQFINTCVHDAIWETLSGKEKRDVFRMFVGMKSDPMILKVHGTKLPITIPCTDFFTALKRSDMRLHQRVVKDFYRVVCEFY